MWMRPARTAAPALPARLTPGATWSGTLSGNGPLPPRTDLHLSFGYFVLEAGTTLGECKVGFRGAGGWYWLTDHTFRV